MVGSSTQAGTMDNQNTVTKTLSSGYNEFEGLNFFNVFPGDATSFYKAPYLIVRGYKNKVDLGSDRAV
jgi:hypothetical protein